MSTIRHITLPSGFLAGAVHCGIKSTKQEDLTILACEADASAAIMTTTNQVVGAPVLWLRRIMPRGYGKARGVPMAIEKAAKEAKQKMVSVPLVGDTVSHEQQGEHKAAKVLLKPAAPGTGVKAGSAVRAIMSVLGVHNVLTKSLGNNNPINLAKATMNALQAMRSVEETESARGTKISPRHPQWRPPAGPERQAVQKPTEAAGQEAPEA